VSTARPVVVLATPVFGAPVTPEMTARMEAIPGVRVTRISRDGVVHGDAEDTLAQAEVLLRGFIPTATLDHIIERAPRLTWIHSVSAGVDKVVTPLARARNLQITNARGVFSRPIAEYVVMACLAVARRLPQLIELQRERTWQPLPGDELGSRTVGIIGYGSIGAEVARLLAPFGPRILATRRNPDRGSGGIENVEVLGLDGLDRLLAESDFVVLATPLTDTTEGLIGDAEMAKMRPGTWLINIARGRLINEQALGRALTAGTIGGAVLDVFDEEPLPADSALYDLPNLVITPHTSWSSDRVAERGLELFLANLARYVSGEPLENVVDLEAGY
jgi:phosphoglycerate dehydrogenase-like enzyme